jgi:zinc transport system substrate-binding protein
MPSARICIKRSIPAAALSLGLLAGPAASAAAPEVVVSIKPLHSLVAGVTDGIGEPKLLVRGAASPHIYSLRPSDAQALAGADVVFWLGEGLELFLARPLATLAEKARRVELGETPGLIRLEPRAGGLWEPHADDEDEAHVEDDHGHEALAADDHDGEEAHDHGHAAYDSHLWLDPRNAARLVARIAAELSAADPAHAQAYERNAATLTQRIEALDSELAATLAPVRDIPFIVFHDAYQYLEARYGLAGSGSITVSPEQPPGARRLREIREKIVARQARCVFREPNFDPALVDRLLEGTSARTGVLDPEGAALAEGPPLYFELMRGMAQSLRECLGGSS